MKKIISMIILLLTVLGLTRCKVAETETIETVECPQFTIDTLDVPGWQGPYDD